MSEYVNPGKGHGMPRETALARGYEDTGVEVGDFRFNVLAKALNAMPDSPGYACVPVGLWLALGIPRVYLYSTPAVVVAVTVLAHIAEADYTTAIELLVRAEKRLGTARVRALPSVLALGGVPALSAALASLQEALSEAP